MEMFATSTSQVGLGVERRRIHGCDHYSALMTGRGRSVGIGVVLMAASEA